MQPLPLFKLGAVVSTNWKSIAMSKHNMNILTATVILIAFFSLLLLGCDYHTPTVLSKEKQSIVCIDGVAYVRWDRGLSVKLHADGKPYICVDTDTKVIVK